MEGGRQTPAAVCSGYVSTGLLGLERDMRPEYSTTGARKQEGFEVCSPKEVKTHRRSVVARILGIGKIRGADAPSAHAGVFGKGKRTKG